MESRSQPGQEVSRSAHRCQESVRSPRPVADDRIDKTGNRNTVKKVADKTGSADHGSRSNRRARIGKGKLEDPHGKERYTGSFIGRRRIFQEEPVIADESVAVGEHEGKSPG